MATREKAICLRTSDYSETSQVLQFLTRGEGVVRLLAKGSKRNKSKSGGAIDLLSEGDLVYAATSGTGLSTLMEFAETDPHAALRRDARRLYAAMYMVELAGEMLAESDPHPDVYDLLHSSLARLAQADAPAPAVLAYYQWRLLVNVGVLGQLARCAGCGQAVLGEGGSHMDVHLSPSAGGLLCRDCEGAAADKMPVTRTALAGLAALYAASEGRRRGAKVAMPDSQADEVNRLFAYYASHAIGKELKLARYAVPPSRKHSKN
jgi:DNA repair protein RecO (recombination protein O)